MQLKQCFKLQMFPSSKYYTKSNDSALLFVSQIMYLESESCVFLWTVIVLIPGTLWFYLVQNRFLIWEVLCRVRDSLVIILFKTNPRSWEEGLCPVVAHALSQKQTCLLFIESSVFYGLIILLIDETRTQYVYLSDTNFLTILLFFNLSYRQ